LPALYPEATPALAPLPAEEIFRAAPMGEAALSPDGLHLGSIVSDQKDINNLLVFDLRDFKPAGLRGTSTFEISTFQWMGNDRMVFNVLKDKLYSWGLYTADIEHLERFGAINRYDGTYIVGVPRARPGRVIVWITQSSADEGRPGPLVELDAHRPMNTLNARISDDVVHLYRPPKLGVVLSYHADQAGDLALCMTWLRGRTHLFRYHPSEANWTEVAMGPGMRPLAVDSDNRFLWVVTYDAGKGYILRRMNMATGSMEEPVLTDPLFDLSTGQAYFSESAHALAGLTYMQRRPRSVWFSSTYATAQATIDRHRPDTSNVLISSDDAGRRFVYLLTGPLHPGSCELLDLQAKTLSILTEAAPWLKKSQLCPVQPVSFTARDGLRLEGYLAMPAGASKEHPVPLVVLAHGGPWVRDTNEFNPEVQFLASRGYAVLQPNYRGSSGYSPEISHYEAYDYMKMSNDVTDATRAILGTGLIDPKRVAIMGGSFGGYLSVAGVTFEKGLYRCAITMCGVFDWDRFIKSKDDVARPGEYQLLTDEIGKPGRDDTYLRRISPLEHADQINVPVLIAHGTEDEIVDVAQSKKLASALKRRGVPYETFYRAVEGHGFRDYKDRVEFYHRVEAFLAANLGGATLTPVK
jgi:dipeptidyl aminopeptidase/acylaminoacyl peptidase